MRWSSYVLPALGHFFHIPGEALWQPGNVPHGNVEINYHRSQTLGDTRWFSVYTPPDYHQQREEKYPVLYLLHGSNDTAIGWVMIGAANYIMDNLLAREYAREMIIVMPFGHAVPHGSAREVQRTNTEKFEALFRTDVPPAGTTGNADNVPYLGGRDPQGNPVRFARRSGHVSNYDEDKVPAYSLPDPLKLADGHTVTTAEEWKARRAEILTFYEEQIYGRVPEHAPPVTWEVVETDENARGGTAITKKIEGTVGSASDGSAPKLRVTLHVPKDAKGRVPVLLNLSFFKRWMTWRRISPGSSPAICSVGLGSGMSYRLTSTC